MRHLSSILVLLFSFVAAPLAGYADTISTFHLHATTQDGYVDGDLAIDTTTGQAGYGIFILFLNGPTTLLPSQSFQLAGYFGPTQCLDCPDFPNNRFFTLSGADDDNLTLQTNTPLVGYTGGILCNGVPHCDGAGEGSEFVAGDSLYYGRTGEVLQPPAKLQLVSTVQTPEPSTLVFLGTGALALFGTVRRKILHS